MRTAIMVGLLAIAVVPVPSSAIDPEAATTIELADGTVLYIWYYGGPGFPESHGAGIWMEQNSVGPECPQVVEALPTHMFIDQGPYPYTGLQTKLDECTTSIDLRIA